MTQTKSTIVDQEVNKFSRLASSWWDRNGPLKTLHDINTTRLEFITRHVNLANQKVLDVGCGGGILSEALAGAGALVTGIDADSESVQVASLHAKDSLLSIEYKCTPIEEFSSDGFDVVVCMELLEHVQHPEVVIEQCRRLLKPQGYLFVSTISRTLKAYASAIVMAEYVLGILPKQTHDYQKFIKPSELVAMARAVDFDLVDMTGLDYQPITRKASLCADVSVNYMLVFN